MTLATNFLLSFNPVWSMVDLNGVQANDSFYLWVLTNTIPYIPQAIYEDAGGAVLWEAPIQFLANGTLPINLYWDENLTYRLEVRQNLGLFPPSQSDPLIYLVENYIPNGAGSEQTIGSGVITGNLVTNPQFSVVNFDETYTLTAVSNPPSIPVGPGWFLDLVGTGTITLTQVALNTAVTLATNPAYALQVNTTGGWTSPPVLRQRFHQNGHNWIGKTVAISITAFITGDPQNITATLYANGQPVAMLLTQTLGTFFVEYTGNMVIPMFTNLNSGEDAFMELRIFLPPVGDVFITSIQLTESESAVDVEFQQETVERQIDHMFHHFQPKLNYKPIPSYLIGWDFPLNPAQILGASVPVQAKGANTGFYAWDQTIVYQSVTSGVSVSRGTLGSLQLTAQANGQIALIQYLDAVTASKIINDRASVNISGFTNVAGGLTGNVTLWATTGNLPSIVDGTNLTLITTIGANGIPATLPAGWVQIPNLYQNTAFTLQAQSVTNSESADISLNGWNLQGAAPSTNVTYFAIVVGFAPWLTTSTVNFNSISLCPGDIPTRPAPKTIEQTLLDCQQYFWSSFPPGATPATNFGVDNGCMSWQVIIATRASFIDYRLPALMRATPNVTVYNPAAANNNVCNRSRANGSCTGIVIGANTNVKNFAIGAPNAGFAAGTQAGDYLQAHVTADARFGIV